MRLIRSQVPVFALVLFTVALVLSGCGSAKALTLAPAAHPAPPLAPTNLQVVDSSGRVLAPNSWTNDDDVRLSAELRPGHPGALIPEVEFVAVAEPFTDTPNIVGMSEGSTVQAPAMVADERYHWRIRARDEAGSTGPWAEFDGTIGYEPNPPASVTLPPLPRSGLVNQRQVALQWVAPTSPAGIAGFAYSLDKDRNGQPAPAVDADKSAVSVTAPADGDWFVHVRALDAAGNWSPVATQELQVDTTAPNIEDLTYSEEGTFNPSLGPLTISAKLSEPSTVTVAVLPSESDAPVRTLTLGPQDKQLTFQWDGKDGSGALVPAGNYRLQLTAEDQAGNAGQVTKDLAVTNKRIVISLSQEKLFAYQGDNLFLQTPVTTGGPELPTPTGTFHVLGRYAPFTFKSPWPKGSPFWYADSPTNYAILYDNSGYFIHDAPWRTWFGPGSNARQGTPGQDGTGTHGCTNVPLAAEVKLYPWADVGTPVIVQN